MKTINLDRPWMKVLLVLAITAAALGLTMIFCTMAGCGAEIRPIQNYTAHPIIHSPLPQQFWICKQTSAAIVCDAKNEVPAGYECQIQPDGKTVCWPVTARCSASSCERMHK